MGPLNAFIITSLALYILLCTCRLRQRNIRIIDMSRAESANARNATAAPAPSSSRGSNIPSRGPAPVGAYQAYLDCKRRDQEQTKLMEIERMYERRPIHLEWEEHRANVDVIRLAFEAERASTAPQPPPPPPKAGRIASMLPQRQPTGGANATVLESIPGSTRVTVFRPSQQDVLADNRCRWLSKLKPPRDSRREYIQHGSLPATETALRGILVSDPE